MYYLFLISFRAESRTRDDAERRDGNTGLEDVLNSEPLISEALLSDNASLRAYRTPIIPAL